MQEPGQKRQDETLKQVRSKAGAARPAAAVTACSGNCSDPFVKTVRIRALKTGPEDKSTKTDRQIKR